MITIDYEKCIGCNTCISVCPFEVLKAGAAGPEPAQDGICIRCLHCAAVCPENAICLGDLEGSLPGDVAKLPENGESLIRDFLMARRSYRMFKPEPVPRDVLSDAIRVAAWAPSAKNQHPAKWIIVDDGDRIKEMMEYILNFVKKTGTSPEIAALYEQGRNVVMGTAKTLILAYARTNAINPPVDTALALYNAELVLQAKGIGTCWAGYLTRMCNQVSEIKELLKLPEGCQFYGALMVGYPEGENYIHIPNRHKQPDIQWI